MISKTTELYQVEKHKEKRLEAQKMASPPDVTSVAIFDALTNPSPLTRYAVANIMGIDASIITRLVWLLPDSMVDFLTTP